MQIFRDFDVSATGWEVVSAIVVATARCRPVATTTELKPEDKDGR